MEKDAVICPNCDEFIGNLADLHTCPICGANLCGHSKEDDNDSEN